MNAEISQSTVGRLVAARPSRARVFERWGIDFCCGGNKSLADSCKQLAIDLDSVARELIEEEQDRLELEQDWTSVPLADLIANIVQMHHAYLAEALPRISRLTATVREAHVARHPELRELAETFAGFRQAMEAHAVREEQVLFPTIISLEAHTVPHYLTCGSIANAVAVMERDHDDAGADLAKMRTLTNGYSAPGGACATYRAMLDALSELEEDTHRHVHKENSILFPRAEALEVKRICATSAE